LLERYRQTQQRSIWRSSSAKVQAKFTRKADIGEEAAETHIRSPSDNLSRQFSLPDRYRPDLSPPTAIQGSVRKRDIHSGVLFVPQHSSRRQSSTSCESLIVSTVRIQHGRRSRDSWIAWVPKRPMLQSAHIAHHVCAPDQVGHNCSGAEISAPGRSF
jgi:hypothetical protein